METISNSVLTVGVSEHGAELQSIQKNGKEYLWQGDTRFWGRRSPVLFPIVGRVWEDTYRYAGNSYRMGQHGFARDMDFKVTYKGEDGIVYWLESTPETLGKYPFPGDSFCLCLRAVTITLSICSSHATLSGRSGLFLS